MRKILFFVGFAFLLSPVFSQNTTYEQAETPNFHGPKVLIVPFSPPLFITNIGKELCTKNDISFDELRERFRSAMDRNVFISLKNNNFYPLSFYNMKKINAHKEEAYIYNSIGYSYKNIPEADATVQKKGLGAKLKKFSFNKKENETPQNNSAIKNGQLASPPANHKEKYMQVNISNPNLLKTLEKSYDNQYFIFISEIDLNKAANNAYPNKNPTLNEREIKVHYTIFDAGGKIVASGAKKTWFSNNTNNIDKIFRNNLYLLSNSIVAGLSASNKTIKQPHNAKTTATTKATNKGNSDFTKP